MNIHIKEKRYKEFLALERNYNRLWKLCRNTEYVELEEPFQKGWDVKYKIPQKYINYDGTISGFEDIIDFKITSEELQSFFDIFYHKSYTKNLIHVKLIRQKVYSYVFQGKHYNLKPEVKKFYKESEIESIKSRFPNIKLDYFLTNQFDLSNKDSFQTIYEGFSKMLDLKVTPHIITKLRKLDNVLEQEKEFCWDRRSDPKYYRFTCGNLRRNNWTKGYYQRSEFRNETKRILNENFKIKYLKIK